MELLVMRCFEGMCCFVPPVSDPSSCFWGVLMSKTVSDPAHLPREEAAHAEHLLCQPFGPLENTATVTDTWPSRYNPHCPHTGFWSWNQDTKELCLPVREVAPQSGSGAQSQLWFVSIDSLFLFLQGCCPAFVEILESSYLLRLLFQLQRAS